MKAKKRKRKYKSNIPVQRIGNLMHELRNNIEKATGKAVHIRRGG